MSNRLNSASAGQRLLNHVQRVTRLSVLFGTHPNLSAHTVQPGTEVQKPTNDWSGASPAPPADQPPVQRTAVSPQPQPVPPDQPSGPLPIQESAAMNPDVQKFMAMSPSRPQAELPWNRLQAVNKLHRQRRQEQGDTTSEPEEMPWERKKRLRAEAQQQPPRKIIQRSHLEEITPGHKPELEAAPSAPEAAVQRQPESQSQTAVSPTAAPSAPEAAVQRQPESQSQTAVSRPLQETWPVERLETSAPIPAHEGDTSIYDPPLLTPPPPEKPAPEAELARSLMERVSPGQPTSSSIEFVPPARPRPARLQRQQSAAPDLPVSQPPETAVQRAPAPQSSTVTTEIGELPGDLWELIGEPSPTAASAAPVSSEAPVQRRAADTAPETNEQPAKPAIMPRREPETAVSAMSPDFSTLAAPAQRKEADKSAVPPVVPPELAKSELKTAVSLPTHNVTTAPTTIARAPAQAERMTPPPAQPAGKMTSPDTVQKSAIKPVDTPSSPMVQRAPTAAEDEPESNETATAEMAGDQESPSSDSLAEPVPTADEGETTRTTEAADMPEAEPLPATPLPLTTESPESESADLSAGLPDANAPDGAGLDVPVGSLSAPKTEAQTAVPLFADADTAQTQVDDPMEMTLQAADEPETAVAYASQSQMTDFLSAPAAEPTEEGVLSLYAAEDTAQAKATQTVQIQIKREGDEQSYLVYADETQLEAFLAEAETGEQEENLMLFASEEAAAEVTEVPAVVHIEREGENGRFVAYVHPDQLDDFLNHTEADNQGAALIAYAEESSAAASVERPVPIILKRVDEDEIRLAHVDEEQYAEFLQTAEPYDSTLAIEIVARDVYARLKQQLRRQQERTGR